MANTVVRFFDPVRAVLLFFATVALGWVWIMAQPECTTCMVQHDAFHPRSDTFWGWTMLVMALIALGGVWTDCIGLQVLALVITGSGWGWVSVLFLSGSRWATQDAVYPSMTLLAWWALWWAAQRERKQ